MANSLIFVLLKNVSSFCIAAIQFDQDLYYLSVYSTVDKGSVGEKSRLSSDSVDPGPSLSAYAIKKHFLIMQHTLLIFYRSCEDINKQILFKTLRHSNIFQHLCVKIAIK